MKDRAEIVELLLKFKANPNFRARDGTTPLYLAASAGRTRIVKMLLENGADAKTQTNYLWSPLHWAAAHGEVKIVEMLLDHGADPRVKSDAGKTPLDIAIEEKQQSTATILQEWMRNPPPNSESIRPDMPRGSTRLDSPSESSFELTTVCLRYEYSFANE
jgi:ankyrin repeat protein